MFGTRGLLCVGGIEMLGGGRLVIDVGVGLLEGVGEVVVGLGSGHFGGVLVGSLLFISCTLASRSLPNLSSTKLPTNTPCLYLLTGSMTMSEDIIISYILLGAYKPHQTICTYYSTLAA